MIICRNDVRVNTVGMHGLRALGAIDVDARLGDLDAEVLLQTVQAGAMRT